ncbi:MAG TPA: DUF2179 domain-containing protein [Anaerolineales bacterium]|nr:DUF2179 domain-containing protein [Anaerolineales bacterium]
MIELFSSPQAWLGALLIFFLRVCDMSLDTLRVLFVMRGKKKIAWVLGFFQSAIFVLAIGKVLTQLNNPLNIVGYAAGFATGNVVGMIIEERIAIGHILVNIISPHRGSAIVSHLRQNGYAVTELSGRGKDGMVSMINCNVLRKQVDTVHALVNEIDPDAFITAEDVRPIRHGFWRA